MVFFYLYLLYIELLHFISPNKRNEPLFYFYHNGINHDFLSFTYSDFCENNWSVIWIQEYLIYMQKVN